MTYVGLGPLERDRSHRAVRQRRYDRQRAQHHHLHLHGGSNTFAATVAQVAAGQSGTVSFQVNVAAATAAGVLNNTATYSYNNGAGTTVPGSSNTVPFTVRQGASLTLTGQTVAGRPHPAPW